MSKNEMVKRTYEALAALNRLTAQERFQKLVEMGIISQSGEPCWGQENTAPGAMATQLCKIKDGTVGGG